MGQGKQWVYLLRGQKRDIWPTPIRKYFTALLCKGPTPI